MLGLLILVLLQTLVGGEYEGCDYFQNMKLNTDYFIYSPGYPRYYPAGTSCRWYAQAPINSKITIACEDIDLPVSHDCNGDRLAISLTGRTDLHDAQRYCGKGTLVLTSRENLMNTVMQATNNSYGGRFLCTINAAIESPQPCDCGWKKPNRIVGGSPTAVNEFPMMAGLIQANIKMLFCGATIISTRYLVTAGHCVINRATDDFFVRVGDDDLTDDYETTASRDHSVLTIRLHENFDTITYQNDIALIKTTTNIIFSQQVGPACLPFNYMGTTFSGTNITALGWGTTGFGQAPSDKLLKVTLTILSNERCSQFYPPDRLNSSQVCTYAYAKDTCQNDSGGPLCYESYNLASIFLVGIVSYSANGCATITPGVNTRVTSYINWIQRNSPDAFYCVK